MMTLGGAYGTRNYTVKDLRDVKGRRVLTETLPFTVGEAAAAEAGIPVEGHAGLVPHRSTWTGGLRAVGKTIEEALWVYEEIKKLEAAGACEGYDLQRDMREDRHLGRRSQSPISHRKVSESCAEAAVLHRLRRL